MPISNGSKQGTPGGESDAEDAADKETESSEQKHIKDKKSVANVIVIPAFAVDNDKDNHESTSKAVAEQVGVRLRSSMKTNLNKAIESGLAKELDTGKKLSRLKTACHTAYLKFLENKEPEEDNHSPSPHSPISLNNNVKKYPHFEEKSNSTSLPTSYSTFISHSNCKGRTKRGKRRRKPAHLHFNLTFVYKLMKMSPLSCFACTFTMFLKMILVSFCLLFVLYCFMVLHKPTQAFVSRHTQDWIYPFMRTIRFAALPLIMRFPQFHELYEDACLLSNPFFEMNEVSCWPCESVRHVIDLTGFSNFTSGYYHSGVPFIVKDAFSHPVTLQDIHKLYRTEEKLSGGILLRSSHPSSVKSFEDVISGKIPEDAVEKLQVAWKINRAQYARLMRKHFSRPYYIPNSTEISVQHFLFLDGPLADQYYLPITEFANVFAMQAEGRRLIVLVPVKHCRTACKAISVVLLPKDVLFYNWLFWRPISFPIKSLVQSSSSNEFNSRGSSSIFSITYVGSFY